jgi:hypothetical protein
VTRHNRGDDAEDAEKIPGTETAQDSMKRLVESRFINLKKPRITPPTIQTSFCRQSIHKEEGMSREFHKMEATASSRL